MELVLSWGGQRAAKVTTHNFLAIALLYRSSSSMSSPFFLLLVPPTLPGFPPHLLHFLQRPLPSLPPHRSPQPSQYCMILIFHSIGMNNHVFSPTTIDVDSNDHMRIYITATFTSISSNTILVMCYRRW